jgi:hypothetical protein
MPSTDKRPLKVFLCHSSADKPKVRELYRSLRRRGLEPWLDVENLQPGHDWQFEIRKALDNSDAIIIFLSKNSVDKEGYVQREIKFALDRALEMPAGRIFLIPARLEDCELPYGLEKYQWVNLYEEGGYEKLIKALKTRGNQLKNLNVELLPAEEAPLLLEQNEVESESNLKASTPELKSRKFDTAIIVALISLVGTILAALIGSPLLTGLANNKAGPTAFPTLTSPPPAINLPSFTPDFATVEVALTLPTKSPIPTRTNNPEPGYEIVEPVEVLNIAPKLRTFGQLAVEKYSLEERNKTNGTLVFTVNSTPDVPILWRWFWCAANDRILEQNITKISIIFEADGQAIPEDQLATVIFENADPTYQGWKCLTYETVLRNWKPGTYQFIQTVAIASDINDGGARFEAGVKIYEYNVNISE